MAFDTRVLDTDDSLREFVVDVENASLRHRIRAIAELSQWLSPAQPPEVISKPQTRLLARVLLSAVCSPQYLEKKWINGLYDAIESAVQSERCPLFSQLGTANLAGLEASATDCASQFAVLNVGRVMLEAATPTGSKDQVPEWTKKLVIVQASILEKIGSTCRKSLLTKASNIFEAGLRARPNLLETYLDILTTDERMTGSHAALSAVVEFCRDLPLYDGTLKRRLLDVYVRDALLTKGGRNEQYKLESFRHLLGSMTQANFSEQVLPVLEKVQKKNPDSVLAAVTALVEQISIDLSAYLGTVFLPPVLRQLRSSKDNVRSLAVKLLSYLALRCRDPGALNDMVLGVGSVLGGKSGVLAQWYQRHCLVIGLEGVREGVAVSSMTASQASEVATRAVEVLLSLVDKESHEDTRAVSVGCLTRWVLLLDASPPKFLQFLEHGIVSVAKPTATAAASAACRISDCAHLCAQLVPLLPKILERVRLGAQKPNMFHPDAIYGAKVAMELVVRETSCKDTADGKFPWQAFSDPMSFLYPPSILSPQSSDASSSGKAAGPLAPHVCEALCRMIALAAKHAARDVMVRDDAGRRHIASVSSASCVALVRCAVHPDGEVRQAALDAIQVVREVVSDAQIMLLQELQEVVTATSQAEVAKMGMNYLPSTAKDEAKSKVTPPNRFVKALFKILGNSSPGDALARVLLLAHHPFVCHSERGARAIWGGLARRAFGGIDRVERLWHDSNTTVDVTTRVLQTMQGDLEPNRISAQWAVGSLGSRCGSRGTQFVIETMVPKLLEVLTEDDLRGLSASDVDIFFTPANVLHSSLASKRKSVATASKNAARRGKDAEEVEWEERVRAELRAKGKGQVPSSSDSRAERQAMNGSEAGEVARLLAEEQVVRDNVRGIQHRANASLILLSSIFQNCHEVGFECVPSTLPVLMPLLGWKILEPNIQECVEALASSVSSDLPISAARIASALRVIQVQPEVASRSPVVNECLQCVAGVSLSDSGETALEQHTFVLIFPIICEVLNNPPSMVQCSRALEILEIHVNSDDSVVGAISLGRGLRKSMIEAILKCMDRFPQMDPSPAIILATVCTATPLDASEWSPLLGSAGLLSKKSHVRLACLEAIMMMVLDGQTLMGDPLVESRLWLSKFEADASNVELACRLWEVRGAPLSLGFAPPLMVLLSDGNSHVRDATARALAGGMLEHSESGDALLERLYSLYHAKKPKAPPKQSAHKLDIDKFFAASAGAETTVAAQTDTGWPTRAGVAATLKAIGEMRAFNEKINANCVRDAFTFLVENGLADTCTRVRNQMLAAGIAIITSYGGDGVDQFLRPCEMVMAESPRNDEDPECFDWRREGVVVFMGGAAKHLDKDDPKVWSIVQTLSGALSTPSEAVQIAVSDCLAPLMKTPVVKEQGPELLKYLLARCVGGRSYGERRGASFGVAAVVKGLGIAAIKKHDVISTLEAACKSTKFQSKQGALCAFECMCVRLGLLFEPYVIVILPHLLKCFGDSSNHVREAAHDCARAIMSKLSAHGVKLILPAILKSLSDPAWRTKQGAIELLGSMAYCAPRQLADCLPMIVPKLSDAFADTHPKVRDAGRKALEDIGSVIRNPEVASLSMTLMAALSDPSKFTREALEALLACEFMHSIDAPSLALMVPVLQRGMKDRSAEVKRKAALITGNTCSMISEAKDLLPYLSAILPGLKATCVDPIPDVRATAAKALAALVRGLGEDKVGDLISWLIETLKADTSSSERSGGAQALSEVLVVMGPNRAEAVLGDLLPLAAHPKGSVREGVLWVLCFLPGAMGKDFAPMIPQALPVVLSGLSDELEAVRDVALRSGQVLVSTHGKSHADQLLPSLEDGLFHDNWRIRQSSVQLLDDLLRLIGYTNEVTLDEGAADDDARGSVRAGEAIEEALGLERRNRLLASLYLIRSDTSMLVRQSAMQVWKTVVPNTPKALREILPLLVGQMITALASGHEDKRTVAGRALGDIVKKLGDHVLPEVVPFLREGLERGNENMRKGVCLGLAEIMDCATPRQVEEFIDTLVPAIQDALCDPSAAVREQSAQAFHSLYKAVGVRSIEHVVPSLLRQLGQEGSEDSAISARERAVFGLKEVLQLRPRDFLPYLIPKLVSIPISPVNAKALGAVAEVTGGTIHAHFAVIIPALVEELARTERALLDGGSYSRDRHEALIEAATKLISAVETVGINWLCNQLTRPMSSKDEKERKWSTWLVEQLLRGSRAEFEENVPQLLKELLQRLVDNDDGVLTAVWLALKALNGRIAPEYLVPHLGFSRSIIASIVSDARHRKGGGGLTGEYLLPGVNIPRGLEPLLPMYQQGLMYGSPEVRELAASGIGELVEVTSTKYLQPFFIKITGPLIRIVGDRFPPGVKAAILHTLGLLLGKGGSSLKPFVPQLQTTFVKALGDSSRAVRTQGRIALGQLIGLTNRVDPLLSDLASGASSSSEAAVRETMLQALTEVLELSSPKASMAIINQVMSTLETMKDDSDDAIRSAASGAIGCATRLLEALGT